MNVKDKLLQQIKESAEATARMRDDVDKAWDRYAEQRKKAEKEYPQEGK